MTQQDTTFRAGRRSLFRRAAALAAVGGAGDALAQAAPALTPSADALPIPASMRAPGAPVGAKLYGEPSPYESQVVRNVPAKLP